MSGDLQGARALRVVQAFSDLDDDQLVWLAECATFVTLEPGEVLFREGDPADVMFGVLDGEIRAKREQGPPDGRMFVRGPGQVGGMLPHTRLAEFPVTARATLPTRLACFARAEFPELLRRIPILQSRLASIIEEAIATWLADQGVDEVWSRAEAFVAAGVSAADLDAATRDLQAERRRAVVLWLEAELASRALLRELDEAAGREEHAPDLPSVHGNAGELNQVWLNLIDNAVDAVAAGGSITVRTSSTGPEVLVEVIDDGPGIPNDIRWRIFEPFFTTKEVGGGTGIGLDVVSRIVAAHGGDVRVDSSPGGTRFVVLLPRGRAASGSGDHEAA